MTSETGSESATSTQTTNTLSLAEASLMWREVEGEVIVLDKRTWTYMGINGSGAMLWKEIAQGTTSGRLVEYLRKIYEIDEQTAARDVDRFLAMLKTHGLLLNGDG